MPCRSGSPHGVRGGVWAGALCSTATVIAATTQLDDRRIALAMASSRGGGRIIRLLAMHACGGGSDDAEFCGYLSCSLIGVRDRVDSLAWTAQVELDDKGLARTGTFPV